MILLLNLDIPEHLFILLNSKLYQEYIIALNAFNNIITKYNSIKNN